MTADPMPLADFIEFVRASPLGVVATAEPAGRPEAALLSFGVTPGGELLFNTWATSRKAVNLAANPRVAVVVGCRGPVTLQIEGTASILGGEPLGDYFAVYAEQFPSARRPEDGYALVLVRPLWLRRYDITAGAAGVSEGVPSWVE